MSRIAIVLLILLPCICRAQEQDYRKWPVPGPGLKWIQTRNMAVNHSMSEYEVVADSVIDHGDTVFIHDTVWIPRPAVMKIGAIQTWDSTVKPNTRHDSGAIGGLGSGFLLYARTVTGFTDNGGYWYDTKYHRWRHTKKNKYRRHTPKPDRYSYVSACNADTVRGSLLYNTRLIDDGLGNQIDSGYWIGCDEIYFHNDGYVIIPGRCKKTELYLENGQEKKRTVGYYAGKFFTADGKQVGNWRVYALISKQL